MSTAENKQQNKERKDRRKNNDMTKNILQKKIAWQQTILIPLFQILYHG
jgi:hypothetical protein